MLSDIDFWIFFGLIGVVGGIFLVAFTGAFDCGMGPWSRHFC